MSICPPLLSAYEGYSPEATIEGFPVLQERSRDNEKKSAFTDKYGPVIHEASLYLQGRGIYLNETATLSRFALSTGWAESSIWRRCRNPAGMYYGSEILESIGVSGEFARKDATTQYACFRTPLDDSPEASDTEKELAAAYIAFLYYGQMITRFCQASDEGIAENPYLQAWHVYIGGWSRHRDDLGHWTAYADQVNMFSSWVTPEEPWWVRESYEEAKTLPTYQAIRQKYCTADCK